MEATTNGLALSASEKQELAEREAKIEAGLITFVEVADHLIRIRDARLYRQDFDTFDAYCKERWDFGERRAKQLFSAAEVVREIEYETPNHGTEKPRSGAENAEKGNHGSPSAPVPERVVRELAKAPAGTRKAVLERDGHRCVACGASGVRFEVDHIVPLAAGGSNHPDNLRTLCRACHRQRGLRASQG